MTGQPTPDVPTMTRLRQALAHHQAGNLDGAVAGYRTVLAAEPRHPEALHLLGLALIGGRNYAEAADRLEASLAVRPGNADGWIALGLALTELNRLDPATRAFGEALVLRPEDPKALFHLAVALDRDGRSGPAADAYRRVLARQPDFAAAHANLAILLMGRDQPNRALPHFRTAVTLDPADARGLTHLGACLVRCGHPTDGVAAYRRAIVLDPGFAEAWVLVGPVLKGMDRLAEADAAHRAALALNPAFVPALVGRAAVQLADEQGYDAERLALRALAVAPTTADAWQLLAAARLAQSDPAGALAACRNALVVAPDHAEAQTTQGLACYRQGRFTAAVAAAERALLLRPTLAGLRNNLGVALQAAGHTEQAIAAYREALALRADHPPAWYNLATALLQQGHYPEGWAAYEWRWKGAVKGLTARSFSEPTWQGEPLEGRTLLVTAEQGLGDSLQFCRYLPLLARAGGPVLFECPEPLLRLLSTLPDQDRITLTPQGQPLPAFDCHMSLLDAPLRLKTTLATIPAAIPYVAAPPDRRAHFAARLAGVDAPRVGLAWAGAPHLNDPATIAVDRRRSLSLARLTPLLETAGVRFVSLQKGVAALEQEQLPRTLRPIDVMDQVTDFADTAALVANLDLVISVDTAVAHLAGALGKPVWILSRFDGCWRWLEGRGDSPWYPSVRLFRQPAPGDWASVVDDVRDELARRWDIR
jgi:tetratricopeptide (TPR) repeat protein